MYLYYNGYWFSHNEAQIQLSRRRTYNQIYLIQAETHVWTVTGIKQAASQAALTTALNEMETYLRDGGDIGLYLDDQATLTSHYLVSRRALGGTRITDLSYPRPDGADYSTYRHWSFTLEASFAPTGFSPLLEFNEQITFTGNGGPRRVFLETAVGLPVEQQVSQYTTYRAVQSGTARQFGTYPTSPPAIWPDALRHPESSITPIANSGAANEYGVSWNYVFESARALRGNPHRA